MITAMAIPPQVEQDNNSDTTTTCSVCSIGLTVPSTTPVGSAGKTCGTLLVDASKVTEGSAQCMAMMAAIPTCCPAKPTYKPTYRPTPAPVVVVMTPRPTDRATRPPQSQTYPPPFESSWGKPPPPSPPPIDCGWGSSSDTTDEWGSSSGSSSSGYLFGSKGSKAAYKCYHGKASKSKSSKSKYGKSDKEGWGGGDGSWVYANSELDKIKLLTPASSAANANACRGKEGRIVHGCYMLLLSSCLIVGLKVFWY